MQDASKGKNGRKHISSDMPQRVVHLCKKSKSVTYGCHTELADLVRKALKEEPFSSTPPS
eukprot:1162113-Pelagomonas_calceolata.AAC.1